MTEPSNKTRVVIVDDDIPSIDLLRRALSRHPEVEVCAVATNLEQGTELIAEYAPDLLFLDMAFPDASGLEWYEDANIPANTHVVFYTCYQRYIHDALSLKVFDFLLKPFDEGELDIILNRLSAMRRQNSLRPQAPPPHNSGTRALAITSITNSRIIVTPGEIVYFRYLSDRKLWECVLANMKRFILKRQTNADVILKYGDDFVRTHKRFIINIRYLGIISGEDCELLPPFDGITEIKISKSYRRDLMDRFYDI